MPLRRLLLRSATASLCACLATAGSAAGPGAQRAVAADVVAPLLADDGSAYPAAHRLSAAEAAAGGPAPGWATPAQLRQLARAHPHRVVRLRAGARDYAAPRAPAPGAWVFVEGRPERAVRLARRLADAGVERVWVVLPGPAPAR